MTWVLVLAGLALFAVAWPVRSWSEVSSTTIERTTGKPTKTTTVETNVSDTVLIALLGMAGVLVISGAFYTRISKVTVLGNTIELAEFQAEAAKRVDKALVKRAEELDVPPAELAVKAASATTIAAARAVKLSATGPGGLRARASDLGVEALSPELWDQLAEAALAEVLAVEKPADAKADS